MVAGQQQVVAAANRGEFGARIDLAGLNGFQKELGEGLNQLAQTTGSSVDDVTSGRGSALSEGDLTQTIDYTYQGAFSEMKEYANGTVLKLSAIISEVNSAADALAGASGQVSSTSQALSQAASRPGEWGGNERVARADDRIDRPEHRQCQGDSIPWRSQGRQGGR